jgi:hypothetical protein
MNALASMTCTKLADVFARLAEEIPGVSAPSRFESKAAGIDRIEKLVSRYPELAEKLATITGAQIAEVEPPAAPVIDDVQAEMPSGSD